MTYNETTGRRIERNSGIKFALPEVKTAAEAIESRRKAIAYFRAPSRAKPVPVAVAPLKMPARAVPDWWQTSGATTGYFERHKEEVKISAIIEAACRATGYSKTVLLAKRRDKRTVKIRHAVMWVARAHTRRSLMDIAYHMGGFDHSTVLHGAEKVEANKAQFAALIEAIRKELGLVIKSPAPG